MDYEALLDELLQSPHITKASYDADLRLRQQGIYILWLEAQPPVCLKVGIAGERQGKGVYARLRDHYRSKLRKTVLARHLASDTTSFWAISYNFGECSHRQAFLEKQCYFQAIPVPGIERRELERFEAFVVGVMKPRYAGHVAKPKLDSGV
jgi:hypothetical protein